MEIKNVNNNYIKEINHDNIKKTDLSILEKNNIEINKDIKIGVKINNNEFVNNIKYSIEKIEDNEKITKQIKSSLKILNNIEEIIKKDNFSEKEVEDLSQKYNQIKINIEKENEETKSITYFDGILGSKPYKVELIEKNIEKNKDELNTKIEDISIKNRSLIDKVENKIKEEYVDNSNKYEFNKNDYKILKKEKIEQMASFITVYGNFEVTKKQQSKLY